MTTITEYINKNLRRYLNFDESYGTDQEYLPKLNRYHIYIGTGTSGRQNTLLDTLKANDKYRELFEESIKNIILSKIKKYRKLSFDFSQENIIEIELDIGQDLYFDIIPQELQILINLYLDDIKDIENYCDFLNVCTDRKYWFGFYSQLFSKEGVLPSEQVKINRDIVTILDAQPNYIQRYRFLINNENYTYYGKTGYTNFGRIKYPPFDLIIFTYRKNNELYIPDELIAFAIEQNNLEMIKWLVDNGIKPTLNDARRTLTADVPNILEYLYNTFGLFPDDTYTLYMLEYLYDTFGSLPSANILYLISKVSPKILKFLYSKEVPIPLYNFMLDDAMEIKDMETANWLLDNGLVPDDDNMSTAILRGIYPMIKRFYEEYHLQPNQYYVNRVATYRGRKKLLEYIIEITGIKPTYEAANTALQNLDLDSLKYLYKEYKLIPGNEAIYILDTEGNEDKKMVKSNFSLLKKIFVKIFFL